jgi:predicted GNAT family acetyltransferase
LAKADAGQRILSAVRGSDRDIRLDRPLDVDMFDQVVGAFLREREAENCMMLGLCSQMRTGATSIQNFTPYFGVVRSQEAVVGAALIAGFLALLSNPIADAALPLVVADIARAAPDVPGVIAEVSASRRFAELWTASTGRAHRLNMSERIFRLEHVIPPPLVEGEMRLAAAPDHELLAAWLTEFNAEALGQTSQRAAIHAFAARWIARERRTMYLWVVSGQPVSMVGVSGETPNGIRVAPVYTPRALRGRGYASALTAAVTQEQLDNGKRYCFLFTDLANPTSNHIYQSIGYRPVSDVADHRFERPER